MKPGSTTLNCAAAEAAWHTAHGMAVSAAAVSLMKRAAGKRNGASCMGGCEKKDGEMDAVAARM